QHHRKAASRTERRGDLCDIHLRRAAPSADRLRPQRRQRKSEGRLSVRFFFLAFRRVGRARSSRASHFCLFFFSDPSVLIQVKKEESKKQKRFFHTFLFLIFLFK